MREIFRGIITRMFHDTFADFESEVQPAKIGIAQLEIFHDAESVQVVVEDVAMRAHRGVERFLPGMAEGRMPNVMHQRERLNQIDVQAKLCRDGARYL